MKKRIHFKDKLKSWGWEIWIHKYLILLSLLFLIISNFLNIIASSYADRKASVPVADIILDILPAIDLSSLFLYGFTLVIVVLFLYPLFFKVKDLHIAISQFSLLLLIRSFFITLTHLRVSPDAISVSVPHMQRFYQFLIFQNDMFFSGHVAVSFLGFLLFRKEKIGIFFFLATIVMALTVLFMHVHYSIDVFAALFIAYGSYKIGKWFFNKINHF